MPIRVPDPSVGATVVAVVEVVDVVDVVDVVKVLEVETAAGTLDTTEGGVTGGG